MSKERKKKRCREDESLIAPPPPPPPTPPIASSDKKSDEDDHDFFCPICHECFWEPTATCASLKHHACMHCARQCDKSNGCPMCREPMPAEFLPTTDPILAVMNNPITCAKFLPTLSRTCPKCKNSKIFTLSALHTHLKSADCKGYVIECPKCRKTISKSEWLLTNHGWLCGNPLKNSLGFRQTCSGREDWDMDTAWTGSNFYYTHRFRGIPQSVSTFMNARHTTDMFICFTPRSLCDDIISNATKLEHSRFNLRSEWRPSRVVVQCGDK